MGQAQLRLVAAGASKPLGRQRPGTSRTDDAFFVTSSTAGAFGVAAAAAATSSCQDKDLPANGTSSTASAASRLMETCESGFDRNGTAAGGLDLSGLSTAADPAGAVLQWAIAQQHSLPAGAAAPGWESEPAAAVAALQADRLLSVAIRHQGCQVLLIRGSAVVQETTDNSYKSAGHDSPCHLHRYIWHVQPKDIIVAGTDDLFKNLMPEQIVKCVNNALSAGHIRSAAGRSASSGSNTNILKLGSSSDQQQQQQQQQQVPWWAKAASAAASTKRSSSGTRESSPTPDVSQSAPAEDDRLAAAAAAAAQHAAELLAAAAAKAASSRWAKSPATTQKDSSSSSRSRRLFSLLPCLTPMTPNRSNDVTSVIVAVVGEVDHGLTSLTQETTEAATDAAAAAAAGQQCSAGPWPTNPGLTAAATLSDSPSPPSRPLADPPVSPLDDEGLRDQHGSAQMTAAATAAAIVEALERQQQQQQQDGVTGGRSSSVASTPSSTCRPHSAASSSMPSSLLGDGAGAGSNPGLGNLASSVRSAATSASRGSSSSTLLTPARAPTFAAAAAAEAAVPDRYKTNSMRSSPGSMKLNRSASSASVSPRDVLVAPELGDSPTEVKRRQRQQQQQLRRSGSSSSMSGSRHRSSGSRAQSTGGPATAADAVGQLHRLWDQQLAAEFFQQQWLRHQQQQRQRPADGSSRSRSSSRSRQASSDRTADYYTSTAGAAAIRLSKSSSSLADKAPALSASSLAAAAAASAAGASEPLAAVAAPKSAAVQLDQPVGQDSKGNMLHVGSRVAVLTDGGDVTAVGVIRVEAQQRLSKYGMDKVPDGHVGVGGLRIEPHMELAARTATFWVKVEEAGLYGRHPGYTFWGKMSVLQQPATVIPVPLSNLLNLD